MLSYVDYNYFMISYLHWNLYVGPLLLACGIILQIYFFMRPHSSFIIAIVGAFCFCIVGYVDSDVFLFLGELLILPLLWLHKGKS